MPIETSELNQRAVLWAAVGRYDNEGNVLLEDPIEIPVRWEEALEEAVDPLGNTIAVDALAVVDQTIAVDSVMWLGELIDLPNTPTNLKQVSTFGNIPDIKSRHFRKTVSLIRYSNTLPTIE